jgi:hypothetical protein
MQKRALMLLVLSKRGLLTLVLLCFLGGLARPDEPAKLSGTPVSPGDSHDRMVEILKCLNGRWEYSDDSSREFTLGIDTSGIEEDSENLVKSSTAQKANVIIGIVADISSMSPFDTEILSTAAKAELSEGRLILKPVLTGEDEKFLIEVLDANSIDMQTNKIRMRVLHPTQRSVVWYRFGRRLLFERKDDGGVGKPQSSDSVSGKK